jgi:CheY-like chemotaxis protein
MRSERPFDCPISGTTVFVKWRAGGNFLEPAHSYVRCSERDCQYVDLNTPPCPLNISMLDDGSSDRIVSYLTERAGWRLCYPCVETALTATHEQVCRATRRLRDDAGLVIRVGRCAVCRRRRSTLMLPRPQPATGLVAGAAAMTPPQGRAEMSSADESAVRVLASLATQPATCAACMAFVAKLSLADTRATVARLCERGLVETHPGACETCGRQQAVASRRAASPAAPDGGACRICDHPIRTGDNVIARGGLAHLRCWLVVQPTRTPDPDRLVAVVDDHDDARQAATNLLRSAGFRVVDAGTALRAAELLDTMYPDLYLLDLHLPDADGFKLCRAIKRISPSTEVLSLTGVFCRDEHRRAALDAGAAGFLTRPVDHDVLVGAVTAMAGRA